MIVLLYLAMVAVTSALPTGVIKPVLFNIGHRDSSIEECVFANISDGLNSPAYQIQGSTATYMTLIQSMKHNMTWTEKIASCEIKLLLQLEADSLSKIISPILLPVLRPVTYPGGKTIVSWRELRSISPVRVDEVEVVVDEGLLILQLSFSGKLLGTVSGTNKKHNSSIGMYLPAIEVEIKAVHELKRFAMGRHIVIKDLAISVGLNDAPRLAMSRPTTSVRHLYEAVDKILAEDFTKFIRRDGNVMLDTLAYSVRKTINKFFSLINIDIFQPDLLYWFYNIEKEAEKRPHMRTMH